MQVEVLPSISVANHVTMVLPTLNTTGASFEIDNIEQLSAAVAGVKAAIPAEHNPGSLLTEISIGQVITGSMVSTTSMIPEQVAVFPPISVTVKVTLLEPKLAQVNELATIDKITIEQLSEEPPSTSEPVMVALPVASK